MGFLEADFKLLTNSVDTLSKVSNMYNPDLYDVLKRNTDAIIKKGEVHDNCFSTVSASPVEKSFEDFSSNINLLSARVETSIDSLYQYSVSDADNVKLLGKDYKVSSSNLNNQFYYMKQAITKDDMSLALKLSKFQISEDYDADYYNGVLNDILEQSGTKREKVVNAAIFMSTVFPHLPYFWGGGHTYDQDGVDPDWGTEKIVTAGGSETTNTYRPYSLDCSGYVNWLFYNSGVDNEKGCTAIVGDYNDMGDMEEIDAKGVAERVRPGDLAQMNGHVGVVVAVKGNIVTVSHCSGSGSGMNLTDIDMDTGFVVEDSSVPDREGEVYFTHFIHTDYVDDE